MDKKRGILMRIIAIAMFIGLIILMYYCVSQNPKVLIVGFY